MLYPVPESARIAVFLISQKAMTMEEVLEKKSDFFSRTQIIIN